MRPRSLAPLVLALLVLALATPAQGSAPATADAAKAGGMVISPQPGHVVRAHHVWIRIRTGRLSNRVSVRLNGTQLRRDLSFPRRGVRRLQASLSHGLRRGTNVLKVSVRPRHRAARRTTVRFTAQAPSRFVGAGRDRQASVDGTVRLRGAVRSAAPGMNLRWRLVSGPARGRASAAAAASPAARLTSPAGLTAGFRPLEQGRYTLRLTAGDGPATPSDQVTVDAVPRNRLVPIETMARAKGVDGDNRGIRVGDDFYLLRDGIPHYDPRARPSTYLQTVILDRKTLALVSNKAGSQPDPYSLPKPESKLVIVALQPGAVGAFPIDAFLVDRYFRNLGMPDYKVALNTGMMSLIGVWGMKRGDADVNALFDGSGRPAPLEGYLTPDQYGNFGFVPSVNEEFGFTPKPSPPCSPCGDDVGFRVRHLDSRTLAPAAHDGELFRTGTRTGNATAEVERLTAAMAAVPADDVFMLQSVSNRQPAEPGFRAPLNGGVPREAMTALLDQIQQMGGTRNGFNRAARGSGAQAGGGLTYALVGWKGAGEGAGDEIAAGVDGAPEAPSMHVRLRPDRQSRMRPIESDAAPESLLDTMLEPPTSTWPLTKECQKAGGGLSPGDPGATGALNWLPSQDEETRKALGPDPRGAYPEQPFKKARWDGLATRLGRIDYGDAAKAAGFSKAQFLAGQCQLTTEMGWVGNVRDYLDNLASPFADTAVLSYDTVIGIGDKVYQDAEQPDSEATLHWLEFAEILLELAGPITHEVSSTVAGVMELGVWMFGANENGGPNPELPFKARELGSELRDQMQNAKKTYRKIGDVIVTDSAKLAFVAVNGGCLKDKDCPEGWSFSGDDGDEVIADAKLGIERVAFEELLPLAFDTYGLNPGRGATEPDPRWYNCSVYPWWYYTPTAIKYATTAEKWELDTETGANLDLYKVLVLALPGGAAKYFHGVPPSDKLLKRMFDPVDADNPDNGGLGMSPARLMRATKWQLWAGTPYYKPVRDNCS